MSEDLTASIKDFLIPVVRNVRLITQTRLPTDFGEFQVYGFDVDGQEHLALTMGQLDAENPILLRLHSECLTGDALFSQRCDCGEQLKAALKQIASEGKGILLYLRQEGRGIGLVNKLKAYALQDSGADTVEANHRLGLPADARNYDFCREMLGELGVKKLRVMTNNPRKLKALENLGFEVIDRVPLVVGSGVHNKSYLKTKANRLGHLLDLVDC